MKWHVRLNLVSAALFLQVLSLPPSGLSWLAFVWPVPLFVLAFSERSLWRLLAAFAFYRFSAMILIVYFVLDPIMFVCSTLVFLGFPVSVWLLRKKSDALAVWSLPVLWTFWDYVTARYTVLPDFVMMLGNSLGNSAFLGLARAGGLIPLTFFSASIALCLFILLRARRHPRLAARAGFACILLLSAGILVSAKLIRANDQRYTEGRPFRAALVSQRNGSDRQIRAAEHAPAALVAAINKELSIIRRALSGTRAGIVILPDSLFDTDRDAFVDQEAFERFGISNSGAIIAGYRNLAQSLGREVVGSAATRIKGKRYNTLLFFAADGTLRDAFHKKYLAITGEYWPFETWRPFYFDLIQNASPDAFEGYAIFDPGKSFSPGETKIVRTGIASVAPAICLEIHYPAELRRRADLGAELILHTSSNLWAEPSEIRRYVELTDNLRRIEAVSLGLPILVNGRREHPALVRPDGQIERGPIRIAGDYEIFEAVVRAR